MIAPTTCERCGKRPGALLSFEQAAACIGVARDTLRFWAYRLRLVPITKVGPGRGVARVKHRDLETLVHEPPAARLRRVGT